MSAPASLDVAAWRAQYPQFGNPSLYPDTLVQAWWDAGIGYVSPQNGVASACWSEAQAQYACNLMCAHLGALHAAMISGVVPGVATSASQGGVSVSVAPPPGASRSDFAHWLSQTGYGKALLALLSVRAAAGAYVGGSPERAAFRRVGGTYRPY